MCGIYNRETLCDVEYPFINNGLTIRKQVRLFLLDAIEEQDEPVHQANEVNSAEYLLGEMNFDFTWNEAILT